MKNEEKKPVEEAKPQEKSFVCILDGKEFKTPTEMLQHVTRDWRMSHGTYIALLQERVSQAEARIKELEAAQK